MEKFKKHDFVMYNKYPAVVVRTGKDKLGAFVEIWSPKINFVKVAHENLKKKNFDSEYDSILYTLLHDTSNYADIIRSEEQSPLIDKDFYKNAYEENFKKCVDVIDKGYVPKNISDEFEI